MIRLMKFHQGRKHGGLIWTFFLWFLLAMTLTLAGTAGIVALTAFGDVQESTKQWILREARVARNITETLLELGLPDEKFNQLLRPITRKENVITSLWPQQGPPRVLLSPPGSTGVPPEISLEAKRAVAKGEDFIQWHPGKYTELALPINLNDGKGVLHIRLNHGPHRRGFLNHPERLWVGLASMLALSWLLCWPLAAHLARPLRRAAEAADALGKGDLSARIRLPGRHKKQDEICQLANSFNTMADSLQRLVVGHKQLLADISHELRTPLARMEIALALAEQDDGKRGEYLEKVAHQAGRME